MYEEVSGSSGIQMCYCHLVTFLIMDDRIVDNTQMIKWLRFLTVLYGVHLWNEFEVLKLCIHVYCQSINQPDGTVCGFPNWQIYPNCRRPQQYLVTTKQQRIYIPYQ